MKSVRDLQEMIAHYYEVDLDNCLMTEDDWILQLAKSMADPNYLSKFELEYNDYLNQRD